MYESHIPGLQYHWRSAWIRVCRWAVPAATVPYRTVYTTREPQMLSPGVVYIVIYIVIYDVEGVLWHSFVTTAVITHPCVTTLECAISLGNAFGQIQNDHPN